MMKYIIVAVLVTLGFLILYAIIASNKTIYP